MRAHHAEHEELARAALECAIRISPDPHIRAVAADLLRGVGMTERVRKAWADNARSWFAEEMAQDEHWRRDEWP